MADEMEGETVSETKDFQCSRCGHTICQRRGDTLIKLDLEVEFRRRHHIKCPSCDWYEAFLIDRNGKRDKNTLV